MHRNGVYIEWLDFWSYMERAGAGSEHKKVFGIRAFMGMALKKVVWISVMHRSIGFVGMTLPPGV